MPGMRRLFEDVTSVWRSTDRANAMRWSAAIATGSMEILRSRTLLAADKALAGRICKVTTPVTTVVVPGDLFSSAREMYCRGVYWPDAAFLPRQGEVVVDLGANVGLYSVHAACAGARAIAVDAQSGFRKRFESLCDLNDVRASVEIVHALVGSRTGTLADEGRRRGSADWGDEPPELSLNELFRMLDIEHVDLLKIDVEGSEYDLLKDQSWLDKVDRVVMEVHDHFGDPESAVKELVAAGFRCRRASADLRPIQFLKETGYIYGVRR